MIDREWGTVRIAETDGVEAVFAQRVQFLCRISCFAAEAPANAFGLLQIAVIDLHHRRTYLQEMQGFVKRQAGNIQHCPFPAATLSGPIP
jgi:hypothetical protein